MVPPSSLEEGNKFVKGDGCVDNMMQISTIKDEGGG